MTTTVETRDPMSRLLALASTAVVPWALVTALQSPDPCVAQHTVEGTPATVTVGAGALEPRAVIDAWMALRAVRQQIAALDPTVPYMTRLDLPTPIHQVKFDHGGVTVTVGSLTAGTEGNGAVA
ncbi:hypothetical protein [Actinomadura viridis]|uniref:Uncharacterized protein n=1 Tax=Actinomadura viridis TaxID=58110 RepID=A0A931GNS4_9ACTN|nr:hypothetical protein [Actinomadura viridis]MBG6089841.1 hypothetical protein [Actinomadura viridis]